MSEKTPAPEVPKEATEEIPPSLSRFGEELKDALVILLNKQDTEFFGTLAYGIPFHVLDKEQYKSNSGGIPSAGYTDHECIVFLADNETTKSEIIFITIHEIIHIICSHVRRRGNRHPMMWNLAIDHVTNRFVREIANRKNYIKEPHGGCIFFEDIHREFPDIIPEELYEIMCKKASMNSKEGEDSDKITNVYGTGDCSDPTYEITWEDLKDNEGNSTGKIKVTVKNIETGDEQTMVYDSKMEDEEYRKKAEEAFGDIAQDARTLWYATPTEARGSLSGSMIEFLDTLFKVEIPWDDVLEDAVLYNVQNAQSRSWVEKNFYIRHPRVPGKRNKRNPFYLIATVDCSGSISKNDLKRFAGVLIGSAQYYKAIHMIVHDHAIQDELMITSNLTEAGVAEHVKSFRGRGGTSHREPFDRIQNIVQEERVSTILFLTDYYSDVQHIHTDYRWFHDYETIWVLNSKEEVFLDECRTKSIHLDAHGRGKRRDF